MAGQNYPRTTIEEFGKLLIESGDLDPIYLALFRLNLEPAQKARWLLAYWCFYNAGLASYLSDFSDNNAYWTAFSIAAANSRDNPSPLGAGPVNGNWPRGKERRHFRGMQAIKATDELVKKFPNPEDAVASLTLRGSPEERISYKTAATRVQEWRGFGDWISYKVADMLDRCGVVGVDFAFDDAMYKDPTVAALILWKFQRDIPQQSIIDDEKAAVQQSVQYLIELFSGYKAPPLNDRPIGYQEIETILCKWKSHLNGHYPFHNDIHEIRDGTAPWATHSTTAAKFLVMMPEVPLTKYAPAACFNMDIMKPTTPVLEHWEPGGQAAFDIDPSRSVKSEKRSMRVGVTPPVSNNVSGAMEVTTANRRTFS